MGAVGEGVVFDGAFYLAVGHFFDRGEFRWGNAGDAEGTQRAVISLEFVEIGFFFPGCSVKADAGQAFADSKDNAARAVIPSIGFILPHNRELDAVDGEEFVKGEAQGEGDQDVDFDQGLAAGEVCSEATGSFPFLGDTLEML